MSKGRWLVYRKTKAGDWAVLYSRHNKKRNAQKSIRLLNKKNIRHVSIRKIKDPILHSRYNKKRNVLIRKIKL